MFSQTKPTRFSPSFLSDLFASTSSLETYFTNTPLLWVNSLFLQQKGSIFGSDWLVPAVARRCADARLTSHSRLCLFLDRHDWGTFRGESSLGQKHHSGERKKFTALQRLSNSCSLDQLQRITTVFIVNGFVFVFVSFARRVWCFCCKKNYDSRFVVVCSCLDNESDTMNCSKLYCETRSRSLFHLQFWALYMASFLLEYSTAGQRQTLRDLSSRTHTNDFVRKGPGKCTNFKWRLCWFAGTSSLGTLSIKGQFTPHKIPWKQKALVAAFERCGDKYTF